MTDDDFFEPAEYGDTLGDFIAKEMNRRVETGIREGITNIRDQYKDKSTQKHEGYMCAYIAVNKLRRTIKFIDYATGIINEVDFKRFLNDAGYKKQVGDIVSTMDNPDDEIGGLFHVGKSSFAKMSRTEDGTVCIFRSNNGEKGLILPMKIRGPVLGWGEPSRYPKEHAHLAREEIGLTVEVLDVVDELLNINHLETLISKWFGILISRGFKIFLKDETIDNAEWMPVSAPKDLKTDGEVHRDPELLQSNEKYISYRLTENLKPLHLNIDVYKNHIHVTSIHVDYCVNGWINVPWRFTPSKEEFHTSGPQAKLYTEGRDLFEKFCANHFERQHGDIKKITFQKDMNRELSKMLEACLKTFEKDPIFLSGLYDPKSKIFGLLDEDPNKKKKDELILKENQELTKDGGNKNGDPVIPIGEGNRGGGGRWDGTGEYPSIKDGGTHDVLTVDDTKPKDRPRTGPIKIEAQFIPDDLGDRKPVCQMGEGRIMYINTSRPITERILKMPIMQRLAMLKPMMAEALVEFIIKDRRITPTIAEYRLMISDLLAASLG
jgi:hypothetical protein